jgi:hypothetical protein
VVEPDADEKLRDRVAAVLALLRERIERLAADPKMAPFYAQAPVLLRVISPLAEGVDRLVAEEALALGYQLTAPLPFAQAEYETDFPDTIGAFRALLAQAGDRVLELDGGRKAAEGRSYEAVGRLVVRHCDLLIAIWDGGPGKGRGGTADIVRYAARHRVPIWWIGPDGGAPLWVDDIRALHTAKFAAGDAAGAALVRYLDDFLAPPLPLPKPPNGMMGRLLSQPEIDPLGTLLAEKALPKWRIWRSYRWFMDAMAWPARKPATKPESTPETRSTPHATDVWRYWQDFYQPTDELAVGYGDRYRSSYVLVFGLAAAAVTCAVSGLSIHEWVLRFTTLEFTFLLLIGTLVGFNLRQGWHARLIGYRLMAELFRKQQALATLGWSLPAAETVAEVVAIDQLLATRESWVGWYFNAAMRAAPLPRGQLAGPALTAARNALKASLVNGQAAYHAHRRERSLAAAERLGHIGETLFFATLVLVAGKLAMLLGGSAQLQAASHFVGLAAAICPALSACSVGIRSYAELELLADQSAQMEVWIENAATHIDGLDLATPMASQDLGAEILDLSQLMLRDIQGWAQLFRLKAVEPG